VAVAVEVEVQVQEVDMVHLHLHVATGILCLQIMDAIIIETEAMEVAMVMVIGMIDLVHVIVTIRGGNGTEVQRHKVVLVVGVVEEEQEGIDEETVENGDKFQLGK